MNYLETYEAIEKLAMQADEAENAVLADKLREVLDLLWHGCLGVEECRYLNTRSEVKS